jgi:hypothetical protein
LVVPTKTCIARLILAKARATLITSIFRLSLGRKYLFLVILLAKCIARNGTSTENYKYD